MRVWVTNAPTVALYYIGYVGIAMVGTFASVYTFMYVILNFECCGLPSRILT